MKKSCSSSTDHKRGSSKCESASTDSTVKMYNFAAEINNGLVPIDRLHIDDNCAGGGRYEGERGSSENQCDVTVAFSSSP